MPINIRPRHHGVTLTLFLLIAVVSGCTTATQPAAPEPDTLYFGKQHAASVALNVTGGRETDPAGASGIPQQEFHAALADMIKRSGLFNQVGSAAPDYYLDVQIARLDQPRMDSNMTVILETKWTLRRASDKTVIWEKLIPTIYTARAGDALAGVTRLRLANEGALRINSLQALKKIAALDLR